jgi:adenylate kinase
VGFFLFCVIIKTVKPKDFLMKPTMFVFMGGQGSGKGTFANLLLKQHDYTYIETGAILRNMPQDSELCKKMQRGELVSDEDLFPIISEQLSTQNDVIMDGFPRTLPQAKWLIENYADKFDIKILFLNISEQTMIAHIQKRVKEGGNRKDDADEAAVQKRIAAFKTTTMPAIEWLKTIKNITFYDIKLPSDDIDINFAFILKTIEK